MLLLRLILILSLVAQLARPPELIVRMDLCRGEIAMIDSRRASRPAAASHAATDPRAGLAPAPMPGRPGGGCGLFPPGRAPEGASACCGESKAVINLSRLTKALAACSEAARPSAAEAAPPPPPKKPSCGCSKRDRARPDAAPPRESNDDEGPTLIVVAQTCPSGRCPTGRVPPQCCERVPAPPRKPAEGQPTLILKKRPTMPLLILAALEAVDRPPFAPAGSRAEAASPRGGGELRPSLCIWRN